MCQHTTFVSINRFERKKDVGKAVRAFALLAPQLEAAEFTSLRLILAGGYDPRVAENVEYKQELEDLASGLGVKDQVVFKPSFSGEERSAMLEKGLCIVYTPANEHFWHRARGGHVRRMSGGGVQFWGADGEHR